MSALGIILILLLVLWLFWPHIMKWLQGFMARRAEDAVRRMMGAPSRAEEKRARKAREKQNGARGREAGPRHRRHEEHPRPAAMMREVAEDVQYTEVHEYSESRLDFEKEDPKGRTVYHETQVEDARYTEIKSDK